MSQKNYCFVLIACIISIETSFSQSTQILTTSLKKHVYALADDSMGGRNTGTVGGALAANYIQNQYKQIGLIPKGDNQTFLQKYSFSTGKKYEGKNSLRIGGRNYDLNKDYFAFNYSSNGHVKGTAAFVKTGIEISGVINDYEIQKDLTGKIFFIDASIPSNLDFHTAKSNETEIETRVENAIKKGAKAIVLYSSDTLLELKPNLNIKTKEYSIPIVYLKSPIPAQENLQVSLQVNLEKEKKSSQNIVGFIDNNAASTIVIGAHYDHLGLGEDGNSLYRGVPAIHNGADDNASGVASVIELARTIKNDKSKYGHYNYLILSFSGEELGLFGSKCFVDNMVNQIDSQKIDCMINLDMVGRLSTKDKNLEINGVGSSPSFDTIIKSISIENIRVKEGLEGIGPSDHTSFYLRNIPVLHFFTGQHEDYHKPTDDADKVNFEGMQSVCNYILQTIEQINNRGRLVFTKTKENSNENTPRFKVTLGIIPDYMFDGKGLRIDGVSDGRPAQKAGLLKGDIILKMGAITIDDMTSYMKALGVFKKGDEVNIKVQRGNEFVETKAIF